MIPLGAEATDAVLAVGDRGHRGVALRHAVLHGRPGLWGDHPARPSSVIWLRDGGNQWDVFGAGSASPALAWLVGAATDRPIVLAAPAGWEPAVRERLGPLVTIESSRVEVWLRPARASRLAGSGVVRMLDRADAAAFAAVAPAWAFRSWGDFATLIERGSAWGVAGASRLVAVAWVVEADPSAAKVGVATAPRFRRLGLGRLVAAALVAQIEQERTRQALWVVNPGNTASTALARSLGFVRHGSEPLLRWVP